MSCLTWPILGVSATSYLVSSEHVSLWESLVLFCFVSFLNKVLVTLYRTFFVPTFLLNQIFLESDTGVTSDFRVASEVSLLLLGFLFCFVPRAGFLTLWHMIINSARTCKIKRTYLSPVSSNPRSIGPGALGSCSKEDGGSRDLYGQAALTVECWVRTGSM